MARPRMTSDLFIFMNGQRVGRLTRTSQGQLKFAYADEWLGSSVSRPISLSMPLGQQAYTGEVVDNFFENLLPDSVPIRNRIQARFGARSNGCFDLLTHIGRDCVGAIQLLAADTQAVDVRQITATEVNDTVIAEILRNYATMPLGIASYEDDFRISIAGAQEKTALLWNEGKWYRPVGVTPTSHILKLPIGILPHVGMDLTDSVENEWLCLNILKAYGLPTADVAIAVFDNVKALVIERFDRRWSEDRSWLIRLPQEDFCQALNVPPGLKYENQGGPGIQRIMEMLLGSNTPLDDRVLFLKSQVLFWLLGGIDGHAKNFSIALLQGGGFKLTPLYDVMSAYTLVAKGQMQERKLKMAMAVRGKSPHYNWDRILRRHWLSTAKLCQFPAEKMEMIIDEIMDQVEQVIDQVTRILPTAFPGDVATSIFDGMRKAKDMMIRSSESDN